MKKDYCFLLFFSFLFFLATLNASAQDVFDVARSGTVAEAESLFKRDPSVFTKTNEQGYSPLILAVYRGNNAVARYIAGHGAEIDGGSGMGTALMAATVKGNRDMVQFLLEQKADPNLADANGNTALIYAAMFKNAELVKMLLAHKADKTKKDGKGKTAFEYAVFSGDQATIALLK